MRTRNTSRFRDCFVVASLLLAMTGGGCDVIARRAEGPRKQSPPYREARLIMACPFDVKIFGLPRSQAQAAAAKAFAAIQRVDDLMSNYKESSELTKINRLAPGQPLTLSDETFAVLSRALEFSELSGGAFDVTVGPLVRLWGFFKKEKGHFPSEKEIQEALLRIGYRHVHLDRQTKTVWLDQAGMELDFGGIAKGYAVDLALDALRREGVRAAAVSAGSNTGTLGAPEKNRRWQVGVKDPKNPGKISKVIEVGEVAVSTSANTENYFDLNGKRYGHILDPRTGRPLDNGVLSVTVVAPRGLDADPLSTTLFVLGPKKGAALAKRLGVETYFVLDKNGGRR